MVPCMAVSWQVNGYKPVSVIQLLSSSILGWDGGGGLHRASIPYCVGSLHISRFLS